MLRSILTLTLLLATAACDRHPATAAPENPAPANASLPQSPSAPNPKLETLDLFIGSHRLPTEIARTPREIQTGMMFRTSIKEGESMLVVFARPHRASFWMKNVTVELSVAYLDSEGRIVEIHDLEPGNETPVWSKQPNVQFALETSRGWFKRHNIQPGTLIVTEKGSLSHTFFGKD